VQLRDTTNQSQYSEVIKALLGEWVEIKETYGTDHHIIELYPNCLYTETPLKISWRKLHNEKLHNLYSSPSMIRIIKSKRMRWVGHVA
jgi:hypothetical protein